LAPDLFVLVVKRQPLPAHRVRIHRSDNGPATWTAEKKKANFPEPILKNPFLLEHF
jgi:hypothetical protein